MEFYAQEKQSMPSAAKVGLGQELDLKWLQLLQLESLVKLFL